MRASACHHRLTERLYARVDVQERAVAFGVLAIDGVSGWCRRKRVSVSVSNGRENVLLRVLSRPDARASSEALMANTPFAAKNQATAVCVSCMRGICAVTLLGFP